MGNKGMLIIYLSLVNCAVLCITKHRKLVLTSFAEYCAWYSGPCMYWMRLSKISWFACGKQINYLPKLKAESIIIYWSARHWQITIFCDNRVQSLFYYSITKLFFFLMNILLKRSHLPFPCKRLERSQEGEKHGFINAWELKSNLLFAAKQLVRWHCTLADHQ